MKSQHSPTDQADAADFDLFVQQQLGQRTGDERSEIERYLRANPGNDMRDWKHGSSRAVLNPNVTDSWMPDRGKAEYVRAIATSELARRLPQEVRQAASRDPNLTWSSIARRYRVRQAGER
ncbi:hypothetical protein GCM10011529_30650 [Polymorphobacter glacialis]|uniref:Uncharacterized protein n=1 Tax=Sandarakinorhabdus glacialis TaxID=1614636 RepID=A0A917EBN7_9SPHN|nr:hypothetical protein [Polymorphobacter glacialis]GGE21904.1 hypothetical protein GCM10011529_30650 [Polymorphobacter glacialis]